jgi:hypothetical protein
MKERPGFQRVLTILNTIAMLEVTMEEVSEEVYGMASQYYWMDGGNTGSNDGNTTSADSNASEGKNGDGYDGDGFRKRSICLDLKRKRAEEGSSGSILRTERDAFCVVVIKKKR